MTNVIQGGLNPVVAAVTNTVPRAVPTTAEENAKQVKAPVKGQHLQRYAQDKTPGDDLRGRRVDVDA